MEIIMNTNDLHIAVLCFSDFYGKAYYNTNLSVSLVNEHGERLSMQDPTHTRRDDTPNARLYVDTPMDELPKYAYINLNPSWKKSRILTVEQFETLKAAKTAKKASTSTQASA